MPLNLYIKPPALLYFSRNERQDESRIEVVLIWPCHLATPSEADSVNSLLLRSELWKSKKQYKEHLKAKEDGRQPMQICISVGLSVREAHDIVCQCSVFLSQFNRLLGMESGSVG